MHRYPLRQVTCLLCIAIIIEGLGGVMAAAEPAPPPFVQPKYEIFRVSGPITVDGKLDEPSWIGAPAVSDFVFPWWSSGPKEQSVAKLLWDDQHLYIACICADQHITASVSERDGPVHQDDCFEVMLAPNPDQPDVYFNIEWNVIGGILDNFRPKGPKQPRAPKWDAQGIKIAGAHVGTLNDDSDKDQRWVVEVAIPFANFTEYSLTIPPKPGLEWNLNLNRHGGKTNPQYSQWSAGDTPAPSFHTPHRFGRVIYSAENVPVGQSRRFALSPLEAVARMTTADGLIATPFAAEPNIRQPILVKCDDRGRLWVIQYLQYPNPAGLQRKKVDRWSRTVYDRVPEPPPRGPRGADKITICEDTDGDGHADQFTDFVDGLNLCTGLAFGDGGVFVLQVPYLLFYPDRDRNDVPDQDPEVLLTGFGMEDAQSFANHLTWGPDGWLYGVNGSTTTCNIRGVEFQQGVWRYHPRSKQFELFCEGGGNLFGLTFDRLGQMFFTSNGGDLCMHGVQGAYYRKAFTKHGPLHNPYAYGYFADVPKNIPVVGGPCTSGTIYLADALPNPLHNALLCGDFLGHTCSWWQLQPRGSTFTAIRGGTLLASNDPWFGATDLCYGPDGAVYISDFHDRRTAHPDPDANWDRSTGRIFKLITAETTPTRSLDLARKSNSELVELLRHPSGWFRERARVLLAERQSDDIRETLQKEIRSSSDPAFARECLWTLAGLGNIETDTLKPLLSHSDPSVRYWSVRLAGESGKTAVPLGQALVDLGSQEPEAIVRAQLAATAKRLPGSIALPIIREVIERNADAPDSQVAWLLWWALEDKALSDQRSILEYFASNSRWEMSLCRTFLPRLIRRYAAEGTASTYEACSQMLAATPEPPIGSMLEALSQGLAERSAGIGGIGQGELFRSTSPAEDAQTNVPTRAFEPVRGELRDRIDALWQRTPTDTLRTRLAIQADVPQAYTSLLTRLDDSSIAEEQRLSILDLLAEFGRPDCVDSVFRNFRTDRPIRIQLAALRVLQRFDDPVIGTRLVGSYSNMDSAVRTALVEVLFSRPQTAAAILNRVERGEIPAAEFPLAPLREISRHGSADLDALVRKHWGIVKSATPEEKLAVMRRLNNDLRVEKGNTLAGKQLFQKHCASCHRLFGEGEKVGPDLTNTSRKDTEFLLASLVDPSAVIRREYVASIVVTTGGQVLTGLIVEKSDGKVTLVDSKGQRQELAESQVSEINDSELSLMPEGLPLLFSPRELRDLFSYLQE